MNIDVCDGGPYRHELCRKKGSGRIARAQKDVLISEVHATRVSCFQPSYFVSGSMPKVIVNLRFIVNRFFSLLILLASLITRELYLEIFTCIISHM